MVIKDISDFKPRKKYIIYGDFMNYIMTFKQIEKCFTIKEIQQLIKDGKIVKY